MVFSFYLPDIPSPIFKIVEQMSSIKKSTKHSILRGGFQWSETEIML